MNENTESGSHEMTTKVNSNSLYPELSVYHETNGNAFRLHQICEVKKFFENEIEERRKLYSKYKKVFDSFTYISGTLNALDVAFGSVSITSLLGAANVFVGIVLGGVAIGGSLISVLLQIMKKKIIIKKLIKHEQIYTLAISKLNTINDLVSKALSDSKISHEEFKLIIGEKEKYVTLKNSIRKANRVKSEKTDSNNVEPNNLEELKKSFLEEGKNLAKTEMIEKLKN